MMAAERKVLVAAPVWATRNEGSLTLRKCADIPASESTLETVYRGRREWLKGVALAAPAMLVGCGRDSEADASAPPASAAAPQPELKSPGAGNSPRPTQTSYQDASHYNNYYEFVTDKADPAPDSCRSHDDRNRRARRSHRQVRAR